MKFEGTARRCVAMPLGGIGTGHFCICGDGSLRQWQISNTVHHLAYLPYCFFALKSADSAVLLQTDEFAEELFSAPAPGVLDHIVPDLMRSIYRGAPKCRSTIFDAVYPIAKITYDTGIAGLTCEMKAYTPLVPFDSRDSSIPMASFLFTMQNTSDAKRETVLLASLCNCVGWDGVDDSPFSQTKAKTRLSRLGANRNVIETNCLRMISDALEPGDPLNGELAIACLADDAGYCAQWNDFARFWQGFSATGEPVSQGSMPSADGTTWNGAVYRPLVLLPYEKKEVEFVIAWRFPNRYVNFSQNESLAPSREDHYLGNEYCTRFHSTPEIVDYYARNRIELRQETERFTETFCDTNVNEVIPECILSNVSTLRTAVCMRTEDGNFYGFEGACGAFSGGEKAIGGCCPMNCTHVWNYDQTLFPLWPDLHRNMRDTDWKRNQHALGYLPHRTILPLALPRFWDVPIGGPTNPAADGLFAGILKTFQHWRAGAPDDWLRDATNSARKALEYATREYDTEGDGVIRGEQPNTYDIHLYGPNTFIGSQYLVALKAAAKMFAGSEFGAECELRFASGSNLYDALCWNGEYYIQVIEKDAREFQYGDGCMSDQLLGQWWAHVCGLGNIFPKEHVQCALASIVKRNFKRNFCGFQQKPRQFACEHEAGLLNATYEPHQRPQVPLEYSDEVWTGVEYALASLLIYEGMLEDGLAIVQSARDRYSGERRNPFNEIECGDHYVRPLSSFSLILAITGVQYERGTLSFAPMWAGKYLKSFFIAGEAYGLIEIEVLSNLIGRIQVLKGDLRINKFAFTLPGIAMGGWRWSKTLVAGQTADPLANGFEIDLSGVGGRIDFVAQA